MSGHSASCMWMRGGTSKGGYFLKDELPADAAARDAFLLRVMGSPDPRQIDGMGGADPLTSKVAVIRRSEREGIDVDYLFLQVFVDQAIVTDQQNCGNILAGVGPFAIERGLVSATGDETRVAIFMENTGQVAVATVQTPGGVPTYQGQAKIDGVPGTHAPIPDADAFLRHVAPILGMDAERTPDAIRAGLVPCGGPIADIAADGVILTGDAAGIVSPLTAGGIHSAWKHGWTVGEAIARHLRHGGPPPERVARRAVPRYRTKRLLRKAFDTLQMDWPFDLLVGTPPLRWAAERVYFNRGRGDPD